MNKEELYKKVQDKIKYTKEEFDKLYDDAYKEVQQRAKDLDEEMSDDLLNKYALSMVANEIKKQYQSPSKKYRGWVIGINDNGALNKRVEKVRVDSILKLTEDKENAILMKYVNEELEPLWHPVEGVNVGEWQLGKKITDNDYTETVLVIAKLSDEDKKYSLKYLTLKGKKRDLEKHIGYEVEFLANQDKKDDDKLNQSVFTEFNVISKEKISLPELVSKYIPKKKCKFEDVEMWFDKYSSDYDEFLVLKGNIINIIPSSDESKSHIINISISDPENYEDFLDKKDITCWYSNKNTVNFKEGASDVYVLGRPNVSINAETGETRISMNVFGLYVDDFWKIQKPQKIEENKIIEKTVEKEGKVEKKEVNEGEEEEW